MSFHGDLHACVVYCLLYCMYYDPCALFTMLRQTHLEQVIGFDDLLLLPPPDTQQVTAAA